MPELHVLRVFTNEDGEWGNRLGVVLEGRGIAAPERQRVAAELGFSETVFVEDRASGRILIHTPQVELPFAGHPCVGAAWLLARTGTPVETLRPPAGKVDVKAEDDAIYVGASPQVDSAIPVPPARHAGRGPSPERPTIGQRQRLCLGLDRRGRRNRPRPLLRPRRRHRRGRGHRFGRSHPRRSTRPAADRPPGPRLGPPRPPHLRRPRRGRRPGKSRRSPQALIRARR